MTSFSTTWRSYRVRRLCDVTSPCIHVSCWLSANEHVFFALVYSLTLKARQWHFRRVCGADIRDRRRLLPIKVAVGCESSTADVPHPPMTLSQADPGISLGEIALNGLARELTWTVRNNNKKNVKLVSCYYLYMQLYSPYINSSKKYMKKREREKGITKKQT